MPKYMLLLYAGESDATEKARRDAEMPEWYALTQELVDAGIFRGSDRLAPFETATTVRVRSDETEILDGPFAITKEYLGGYYVLECDDLDNALKYAARMPVARYGSVEVRPLMEVFANTSLDTAAGAA